MKVCFVEVESYVERGVASIARGRDERLTVYFSRYFESNVGLDSYVIVRVEIGGVAIDVDDLLRQRIVSVLRRDLSKKKAPEAGQPSGE